MVLTKITAVSVTTSKDTGPLLWWETGVCVCGGGGGGGGGGRAERWERRVGYSQVVIVQFYVKGPTEKKAHSVQEDLD